MQTNKTVSLVRESKDWEGRISRTALGSYDVWLEERKTVDNLASRQAVRGSLDEVEVSKGFVFLFSEVDLTDTVLVVDGSSFAVSSWDNFFNRKGSFHHSEVFYK